VKDPVAPHASYKDRLLPTPRKLGAGPGRRPGLGTGPFHHLTTGQAETTS
jgi:hypothetical protein